MYYSKTNISSMYYNTTTRAFACPAVNPNINIQSLVLSSTKIGESPEPEPVSQTSRKETRDPAGKGQTSDMKVQETLCYKQTTSQKVTGPTAKQGKNCTSSIHVVVRQILSFLWFSVFFKIRFRSLPRPVLVVSAPLVHPARRRSPIQKPCPSLAPGP